MSNLNSATRTSFTIISSNSYLDISPNDVMYALQANKAIFWSWGASNFKNIGGKGIQFKVNGRHHKGYVMICLHPSDTFDVYIISTHGKIKDHYILVYVDELATTIDRRIEHIPAYQY